jgi:hypothetical protein
MRSEVAGLLSEFLEPGVCVLGGVGVVLLRLQKGFYEKRRDQPHAVATGGQDTCPVVRTLAQNSPPCRSAP